MINLSSIDPNALYSADDASVVLHVHRTTIHKRIFPNVPTVKVGKRLLTKGEHLRDYLSGTKNRAA